MNDSTSDRPATAAPPGLPSPVPDLSPQVWAEALFALVRRAGAALSLKEIASGRVVWADAAYLGLFAPGVAVIGALESSLVPAGQLEALREAEQAAVSGVAPVPASHWLDGPDERRDFAVSRVVLRAADASPKYLASLWLETTGRVRGEQQLQRALAQIEQQQASAEAARREAHDLALRDQVTGLYQRPQFDDLLRREVDLSSREHREFALAAIEIDPPGEAVRALGDVGEQRVIEALGRLLRGNTRAMDASCRLDGPRFAVLLSGVGLATAHSRMESMRRQCATQIVVHEGRKLGFTVSMGVASFPHTAHTQEDLLRAADNALAEARRRGGNHVTLASIRFEGV